MGKTTIEWARYTLNPWIGCTKVSPGCVNCYAENQQDTRFHRVNWGRGKPRSRTSEATWRKTLQWDREAELAGRRGRVFCASLADVFDPEVPLEWRSDLFKLVEATPNLDWLLLTKRPENVARMIAQIATPTCQAWEKTPPYNVWIGTSVEDQTRANERIPELLEVSARIRFLSVEPLLSPVDLRPFLFRLDWVIVGGESGPGCRPMNVEWARSIRDQCHEAGVQFFMKQMSGNPKGKTPIPDDLMIREIPGAGEAQLP
jgi:protein gp37